MYSGVIGMTIDELFEARDDGYPVMITVKRARHIVVVGHSLEPADFQDFVESNVKHGPEDWLGGGMVCAALLYEWLGY